LLQVDEALTYDVGRLIRSAMPSNTSAITYSDCSQIASAREPDRLQSKALVDALKNVRIDGGCCEHLVP
jgi:hypothetical protein